MAAPESPMSAKSDILARIRSAETRAFADSHLAEANDIATVTPGAAYPVARTYERGSSLSRAEVIALADERIADYQASVHRVAGGAAAIAEMVGTLLEELGVESVGIPAGLERSWLPDSVREGVIVDESLSVAELDQLDAVVTSSAVTCAETGTIFLDGSATSGRRALTLVPDVHICVVPAESVVYGIPEAISLLNAADPTAPITMISGPSATSDIELSRVEGVHGPRTLKVIIAEGEL